MTANAANIQFLKKSAELGKISHAYIFFGNDIEEKKKTLSNFLEFLKINSADIYRVVPEREIIIAQIRELIAKISLAPWASPFKIAIIENAEKMNFEAQSAFLKLVEEPKGDAIFFLLTEHLFLLLPTIRSRAQQIGFWKFPAPPARLAEALAKRAGGAEQAGQTEFEKLQSQNIEEKFDLAKNLADSKEDPKEVLQEWLKSLRALMLKNLKENSLNSKVISQARTIKLVQETLVLLQTTNVSPRLALERVLLEI